MHFVTRSKGKTFNTGRCTQYEVVLAQILRLSDATDKKALFFDYPMISGIMSSRLYQVKICQINLLGS
jgi:hypothetical protein